MLIILLFSILFLVLGIIMKNTGVIIAGVVLVLFSIVAIHERDKSVRARYNHEKYWSNYYK